MKKFERAGRIANKLLVGMGAERVKPDPEKIRPLSIRITEHYDLEGDFVYVECYEHVDQNLFSECAFYQTGSMPTRISYRYIREVFITPRDKKAYRYSATLFCDITDKGAQPVTVGFV